MKSFFKRKIALPETCKKCGCGKEHLFQCHYREYTRHRDTKKSILPGFSTYFAVKCRKCGHVDIPPFSGLNMTNSGIHNGWITDEDFKVARWYGETVVECTELTDKDFE